MALFAACQGIETRAGFMDNVYPLLQEVLPHERFVCGIATVAPVAVLDVVNAGFPTAFVTGIVDQGGRIASPVIRRWLMSDAPVISTRACALTSSRMATPAGWTRSGSMGCAT